MTKKAIILVLIVLIVINTIFWINVLVQRIPKTVDRIRKVKRLFPGIGESKYMEVKTKGNTYSERLEEALRDWERLKGVITLLIITDVVLIAISFMIILLYKKE